MSQIKDFALHLRLNYNFLILSAPFFLGAAYVQEIPDPYLYTFSFLLVYIFLFGGANAYNSYFDKDDGPIGGLEHPPKMTRWMYYSAWFIQILGLILSVFVNYIFSLFFLFSIILSWIYSGPFMRFKGKPLLSFLVVGIGTVFNSTIMGYLASGGNELSTELILGAIGATLIILSMYPFSQVYQIDEDTRRGDTTFAVRYGVRGVKANYLFLFIIGFFTLSYSFLFNTKLAILTLTVGLVAYFSIWQIVKTISGNKEEYKKVMETKYYGGIAFTLAILSLLIFL